MRRPFALPKCRRARRANDRAALLEDAAHIAPAHLLDVVATFDHAQVALIDGENFCAQIERGAHHGAYSGIHAL